MPYQHACPLKTGRQLRRFFDDHCDNGRMRGFVEDDWVLMTKCPLEDAPAFEEAYPQKWLDNPRTLSGTLGWWRVEVKSRFPTLLPPEISTADKGSSFLISNLEARINEMNIGRANFQPDESTSRSSDSRPLMSETINRLRDHTISNPSAESLFPSGLGLNQPTVAHESTNTTGETSTNQPLSESDRLMYSFYREQRRANTWVRNNDQGSSTGSFLGQLRTQLEDLRDSSRDQSSPDKEK